MGGDELGTSVGVGKERNAFSTGALDNIERKRLHVKQSIYQALNTLKAHSHSDFHSHTLAKARRQQRQPPPSPEPSSLPLGEENAHSTPPPPTPAQTTTHWPLEDPRYRKYAMTYPSPVIPHIPPADPAQQAKAPSPQTTPSSRKLGSKYWLLNLFRQAGDPPAAPTTMTTRGVSTLDSHHHSSSPLPPHLPPQSASPSHYPPHAPPLNPTLPIYHLRLHHPYMDIGSRG